MAKKKHPETKILRQDLDGSIIKQTPYSLGYQVFFRDKFLTFQMDLAAAHSILDHAQQTQAA